MTPAIEIEGLSKVYRISHEQKAAAGTATFRDALVGLARKPAELLTGHRLDHEEFWALRELDLSVEPGEVVGLIGRNGSGKSTLLKILSRIVSPTHGRVHMRGKVASLLEVGTGFHPELTGRENVFFNGAILGMSQREIRSKFDDIVSFSEIERFLDTPVKFYSSGMYVRLAFAVAAHLDPDILIVDEVLAVGDASFQRKSLGRMSKAASEGRTVLFVSHSMPTVKSLCTTGALLENGRLQFHGAVDDAIEVYAERSADAAAQQAIDERRRSQDLTLEAQFKHIELGHGSRAVDAGSPLTVRFQIFAEETLTDPVAMHFAIFNLTEMVLRFHSEHKRLGFLLEKGMNTIECEIDPTFLTEGDYKIDCSILFADQEHKGHIDAVEDALFLQVANMGVEGLHLSQREAVFYAQHEWRSDRTVRL